VLVIVVLLVAGFTPIPADPWWKDSQVIQRLLPVADWAASFLPESVSKHLDFEPEEEPKEKPAKEKEPPEAEGEQKEGDLEEKAEAKTA